MRRCPSFSPLVRAHFSRDVVALQTLGLVCALSSRYYTRRPGLYNLAIYFAKALVASAFIDGWKCVEMCQAYLMLTAYAPPTQRDSKTRPLDERHEREILNRRPTWIICSIMDGSTSLETGNALGVGKDEDVCLSRVVDHADSKLDSSHPTHPAGARLPSSNTVSMWIFLRLSSFLASCTGSQRLSDTSDLR
jgi:hypothetical protein